MREFCAARKKIQKRGKPLEAINAKINALQADLDALGREGGD